LVLVACSNDATPILLMSDLAEHTRNISRDPRASVLIDGTAGSKDAMTGPRVTLLGHIRADDDPGLGRRYLARHPSAGLYAGFGDFRFYRFEIVRAHLVAGFGKIHRVEGAKIASPRWLDRDEAALIDWLAPQATAIAQRLILERENDGDCQVIGADPDGIDLMIAHRVRRYQFPAPVAEPTDFRAMIKSLLALDGA